MSGNPPDLGESALDDDELLKKAKNAANGRKFTMLFEEGWESRAVRRQYDKCRYARIALLVFLTWWTRHDTEQARRLFRQSALWDDDLERYRDWFYDLERAATSLVGDECYDPSTYQSSTESRSRKEPTDTDSHVRPHGGGD